MSILTRALIDHLKEVGWALFLIFLILACLWVIFGRHLGYETIFWICLSFAVIVTAVLVAIILGNLLCIAIVKIFRHFISRD